MPGRLTEKRKAEIAKELIRIKNKNKNKLLQFRAIVDAARPKDSILHDRFTWDNTKAAEEYRLEEARRLVAEFKLQIIQEEQPIRQIDVAVHQVIIPPPPVRVRQWMSLGKNRIIPNGGMSETLEVVKDNKEHRDGILEGLKAWDVAHKSWLQRFSVFSEFKEMMNGMMQVTAASIRLRESLNLPQPTPPIKKEKVRKSA